jgi:citrate lyase beta subunit
MGSLRNADGAGRCPRSILLVPASDPAIIAKAATASADAICIDCEDAVAPDQKEMGREHATRAFKELDFGSKIRMVRINGLDTPFAYRDIVRLAEEAGNEIDLIIVPKVCGRDELRFVDMLLSQIEASCGTSRIGLEALVETAAGLVNLAEIIRASDRLEGLIFGSGDFAASMNMPQSIIGGFDENDSLYPGHRWHHAMCSIVAAARTQGLRAIDGPFADFRDAQGLERTMQIARVLGFDGKWCIHPSQCAAVNTAFAPTERELRWAKVVMSEYDAAAREGRGALSVEGRMIDAANLRTCRNILRKAELTPA